ncbi:galactose oxidase/kelch, beta-propeller [Artemisia annua]|uniref:Galactose oxidase/kelch, beta-propeller n=1 Tax=Artemisia annua TaxID=35608 RepID=A0A2U1KZB3_ARTAN|nr:galactose oxidase/kelch, beta-propeller [Artemisia annua]
MTLASGSVPRMYHSTANLLPDGRILVAAHASYNFSTNFPTELKIEAFSLEYLAPLNKMMRPTIDELSEIINYGDTFVMVEAEELPVLVFGYLRLILQVRLSLHIHSRKAKGW